MKLLICMAMCLGMAAQAKDIPVIVQCETQGPQYEGILSVPDQIEGTCTYIKKDNSSQVYQSTSKVALRFNNLNYEATHTTYNYFDGRTCDWDHFDVTGPDSGNWREIHSNFTAHFFLRNYGMIGGSVGPDCEFLEKTK